MILSTYKVSPWPQLTPNQLMYKLTEMLNNGRDVSVPENMGVWFSKFLADFHITAFKLSNKVWPGFADMVDCIDRGHVAIGGFNNYAALRLANGSNPYKWVDPPNLGHVLLIVGYDLEQQTVIVHDPLRADPSGQPAEYSWKGFQNAVFHDCTEVVGAALPYSINTGGPMIPAGWHDDGTTLTAPNGVKVVHGFRDTVLDPRKVLGWDHDWKANDYPLAPERVCASVEPGNASIGGGTRQDFRMTSLGWTTSRNVYQIWVGQDVVALQDQLTTAANDAATFQQQLSDAKNKLAALQQQQSAPVPVLPGNFTQPMTTLAAQAPALIATLTQLTSAWAGIAQSQPAPRQTTPLPPASLPN